QARELHGGRPLHRDAVLCRRRGPSRGPAATPRARGAALLLARGAHPRRLSRPPVPPRRDAKRGGLRGALPMPPILPALVSGLALLLYLVLIVNVSRARGLYKVAAPAVA